LCLLGSFLQPSAFVVSNGYAISTTITPPTIQSQPVDQTVTFKELARFRVDATGDPPLAFQWRRGGLPLVGRIDSSLEFPYVSAADLGDYDVVVSNSLGSRTSQVARLALSGSRSVMDRRESPGPSSRRTGITFSEVHHQPPSHPQGRDLRFIELFNSNPFPEDLSGWSFAGDVEFTLPQGTTLPGLGFLVVAPRPADITAVYGITQVIGGFSTRLGPGRGDIRLRKRSGAVVLHAEFTSDPAWESASQGGGCTRVLVRPSLGEKDPRAWASSTFLGGSPGSHDPEPPFELSGIRIHEILTGPTASASTFVEFQNRSPLTADLSGATLRSDHTAASFILPPGTLLQPSESFVLNPPAITSVLRPEGGTLLLYSPDGRRVLDAVRYPGQIPGSSWGRTPTDPLRWTSFSTPSPGNPNSGPRQPELTFSEIHFEPPSGDPSEEFLELHNRSNQTIDLTQWLLDGGVRFAFPSGTKIPPGGYLAVARDPARLRILNPTLPRECVVGGFAGTLRNRGEHVALLRPIPQIFDPSTPPTLPPWRHHALEDEIHYQPRSQPNRWAAGGGSSLERSHFEGVAHDPNAWMDSDETNKAPWTLIESTGPLTLTHPGVPAADQLQILLLGPGEVIVDDVEVVVAGVNRVTNGRFDAGTNSWFFQGTHRISRVESRAGTDGSPALHVMASDRGDHVANRIRTVLRSPIPANTVATLRAKVRWRAGHPEILLRLRNGGLEAVGRLNVPSGSGTPGMPNSRSRLQPPPSITEVGHLPALPAAGARLRVVARIQSTSGIESAALIYRRDPSATSTTVPMTDDGSGPDEFAGDGLFSGTLPGQPSGALIGYRIVATDRRGGSSSFPPTPTSAGPNSEHLVRFGESTQSGAFATYRIWMTAATRDAWSRREKMSNEDLPVTFVSGSDRIIQNAGGHYSGSSYSSPGYDSPTGALCGYDLSFPDDDRFLGSDRATLDWPIRDDTDQREPLMFWFLEQYGLPNLYRRYVRLTVNGIRRGTIYDDVQQPDGDTIEQWYPDDDEGSLWKTDCWNEFDNAGNRVDPCILNTLERFPSSGPKKVARYRWNWRPRAIQSSANDFSDLFALIDAATATANYTSAVESLVDVDHWMRTFAMNDLASYWDGFGNPNAKNTFLYKPRKGRWQLFCWDFDVGLGVFNDPPTAALFDVNDPSIARMYRTPVFVRRYWAALQEALDGWFRTGADSPIDRLLDAKYAAFQANGIALANPASIKNWIRQRRTFLLQQLATVRSDFSITSNGGSDFITSDPLLTLSGRAPVGVASIRIQGRDRSVSWNSVSNWTVRIPLATGTQNLAVEGLDRLGNPVPGASDTITVTFNGSPAAVPPLRFNEWLAQNTRILINPFTGNADDWFEIHNAGSSPIDLSGFTLTDDLADPIRSVIPPGFILPAGGFLLVWADGHPEASGPANGLHVGFRLSLDGESLALFDPLGRLVDALTYGPQQHEVSEGRWPDGGSPPFPRFPTPTPGQPNSTKPAPPPDFMLTAVISPSARSVRLTWHSTPGRTYQLEFTGDLNIGMWQPLEAPILAEAFETATIDSQPSDSTRFYRVRLLSTP